MLLIVGALTLPQLLGDESVRRLDASSCWRPPDVTGNCGRRWDYCQSRPPFAEDSILTRRRPGLIVQAGVIAGLIVVAGVLLVSIAANLVTSSLATRNFYGALTVYSLNNDDPEKHNFKLRHGRIVHGIQYTAPDKIHLPLAYYGPDSGLGPPDGPLPTAGRSALDSHDQGDPHKARSVWASEQFFRRNGRAATIYAFYEINPAVTKIATDPNGFFTYRAADSPAKVDIISRRCAIIHGTRSGS